MKGNNMPRLFLGVLLCITLACTLPAYAEEQKENPSNPLAAASNLDLRAKYFDLGNGSDRYTYSLEGATMLHPEDQTEV
jgi:hypothetical protein